MFSLLMIPIIVVYVIIVGSMFLYGIDFIYMTYLSWKHSRPDPPVELPAELPRVTIQLPIYNEMYVAERLVDVRAERRRQVSAGDPHEHEPPKCVELFQSPHPTSCRRSCATATPSRGHRLGGRRPRRGVS